MDAVDSGCCGLAGSFGCDDLHDDVATAAGEDRPFPAVRSTPAASHVVAEGSSCSTRIIHGTDRVAKHVAQIVADAFANAHERTTT